MKDEKIPNHIAFIMDGNGRWADKHGVTKSRGHQKGVMTMQRIVSHCFDKGVRVVTVFAFSTENWKRPKQEIDGLMDILRRFLKEQGDRVQREDIKLNIMGDTSVFPDDILELAKTACERTKNATGGVFNIAVNYGARQEIIRAAKMIAQSGIKNIDEGTFERFLYSSGLPDPDILVRTSGEMRLSNFMLYQLAYTELFFVQKLWPDFKKGDLDKILSDYAQRNRRFGGR